MKPTVLGLDPSKTSFGFALVGGRYARPLLARIQTNARTPIHERLALLISHVRGAAQMADMAVVEGLAYGSKGNATHDLAGLHWIVRQTLWELEVPYVVVVPTTRAKYITGNGRSDKDACLAAAIRRFPDADLTGNDVADALTLAAMGLEWLGAPLVPMPEDRTALLTAVHKDKKKKGVPVINWPDRQQIGDGKVAAAIMQPYTRK